MQKVYIFWKQVPSSYKIFIGNICYMLSGATQYIPDYGWNPVCRALLSKPDDVIIHSDHLKRKKIPCSPQISRGSHEIPFIMGNLLKATGQGGVSENCPRHNNSTSDGNFQKLKTSPHLVPPNSFPMMKRDLMGASGLLGRCGNFTLWKIAGTAHVYGDVLTWGTSKCSLHF